MCQVVILEKFYYISVIFFKKNIRFLALCWIRNEKPKQSFVLVKGNLQGATKNPKPSKKPSRLRISKKSFLESCKLLINKWTPEMTYSDVKNSCLDYLESSQEFYKVHKDWIRTDHDKYYQFV